MARTQTLVQLSDDLLARLDARASRKGRSRPELIRTAVGEYLADDRAAELDRRIVDGDTRAPQSVEETAIAGLAVATMLRAAGPWDEPNG